MHELMHTPFSLPSLIPTGVMFTVADAGSNHTPRQIHAISHKAIRSELHPQKPKSAKCLQTMRRHSKTPQIPRRRRKPKAPERPQTPKAAGNLRPHRLRMKAST
eukprot:5039713-Pyramimonas_sp.AAC.1